MTTIEALEMIKETCEASLVTNDCVHDQFHDIQSRLSAIHETAILALAAVTPPAPYEDEVPYAN